MQQFTLHQLFGASAFQTATEMVINKSDLAAVGLTASSVNTAESLFIAIVLYALGNFEGQLIDETDNIIVDENDNPLGYKNAALWELLEITHWGTYVPEDNTNVVRNQIIIDSYGLQTD